MLSWKTQRIAMPWLCGHGRLRGCPFIHDISASYFRDLVPFTGYCSWPHVSLYSRTFYSSFQKQTAQPSEERSSPLWNLSSLSISEYCLQQHPLHLSFMYACQTSARPFTDSISWTLITFTSPFKLRFPPPTCRHSCRLRSQLQTIPSLDH
jgi:hypothetical protein